MTLAAHYRVKKPLHKSNELFHLSMFLCMIFECPISIIGRKRILPLFVLGEQSSFEWKRVILGEISFTLVCYCDSR